MAMCVGLKPFNSCATDGHVVGQQLRNRWPSFRGGAHAHEWPCPGLESGEGTGRVRGRSGAGRGAVRVGKLACVAEVARSAATHGHVGGHQAVQQLRNRWACCWLSNCSTVAQQMAIFPWRRASRRVAASRLGRSEEGTGWVRGRSGAGRGPELCGSGHYMCSKGAPYCRSTWPCG